MWDGRKRCTDSNECESSLNECHPLHCINTEGGHRCGCRSGYRMLRGDYGERFCEEIDECKEVIGICPQACRNLPGTFNCTCHNGYTATYERGKLICVDVDECQVDYPSLSFLFAFIWVVAFFLSRCFSFHLKIIGYKGRAETNDRQKKNPLRLKLVQQISAWLVFFPRFFLFAISCVFFFSLFLAWICDAEIKPKNK